jgi:hypothetical protein
MPERERKGWVRDCSREGAASVVNVKAPGCRDKLSVRSSTTKGDEHESFDGSWHKPNAGLPAWSLFQEAVGVQEGCGGLR